jgi:hypothetical protein
MLLAVAHGELDDIVPRLLVGVGRPGARAAGSVAEVPLPLERIAVHVVGGGAVKRDEDAGLVS